MAHCIVGAMRSFLKVSIVQRSIKEQLLLATSPRYKAFMVTSLNCTHGAAVGTPRTIRESVRSLPARSCSSRTNDADVKAAIAYMPLEKFTIVSDESHPAPSPRCEPKNGGEAYEKYTSFWYMFSKMKHCYDEVIRYELTHNVCFDWVVKSRTDDKWLLPAPKLHKLPRNVITVPKSWPAMVGMSHFVEDHAFLVPRPLAHSFFNAVDGWDACPPLRSIVERCPFPYRGWQNVTRVLQSECILGRYLNEQNISWRHDARLRFKTV